MACQAAADAGEAQPDVVLWHIQVSAAGEHDPEELCQNANYVRNSLVDPPEHEYLFVPYSVFTVVRTEWSAQPSKRRPHRVWLEAAIDNLEHPEDLPLAPWY